MNLYTLIAFLVIVGIAYSAWKRSQDAKQGIIRDHRGNPVGQSQREAELEEEVQQLRERVKVLERIATDPGRRTAEEIEKLRDE